MGEEPLLPALTLLGILLIIVGVILVIIPYLLHAGVKLENVHPLLLVWKRFDGFVLGTSPLLLIILLVVYLLFFLRR